MRRKKKVFESKPEPKPPAPPSEVEIPPESAEVLVPASADEEPGAAGIWEENTEDGAQFDHQAEIDNLRGQIVFLCDEVAHVRGLLEQAEVEYVPQGVGEEHLHVVSIHEQGFWRLKRKFTKKPTLLPIASLTKEEVAILESEPNIVTRRVTKE